MQRFSALTDLRDGALESRSGRDRRRLRNGGNLRVHSQMSTRIRWINVSPPKYLKMLEVAETTKSSGATHLEDE
jgi:hypothetical protein